MRIVLIILFLVLVGLSIYSAIDDTYKKDAVKVDCLVVNKNCKGQKGGRVQFIYEKSKYSIHVGYLRCKRYQLNKYNTFYYNKENNSFYSSNKIDYFVTLSFVALFLITLFLIVRYKILFTNSTNNYNI